MRKTRLNRIERAELEALQDELVTYVTYKNSTLLGLKNTDQYFSAVLIIDIAQKMCYSFRARLEDKQPGYFNISLSASEACVLLQMCTDRTVFQSGFTAFVLQKFTGLLYKDLTNII